MPATAATPQNLVIGAGDLYMDGVTIGATEADNIFRVFRTYFTPKLNGTPGALKATDYVSEEHAELECSVPELSQAALGVQVAGAIVTAGDGNGIAGQVGGAAGGGVSTTLTGPTVAGANVIPVPSAAGIVAGQVLVVGVAGSREFRTVLSIAALNVTLIGNLLLPHANTDPVVQAASTTLAADLPVGATTGYLVSVTGLVVGSYVRIGYPGNDEVRILTRVGTAGAGGTGVDWAYATQLLHRSGDYVVQQVDGGQSAFASNSGVTRRIPATAYHTWELRVPALGSGNFSFFVYNGISLDTAQYDGKDAGLLAPRLKIQSRWDAAAPATSPWKILLPR